MTARHLSLRLPLLLVLVAITLAAVSYRPGTAADSSLQATDQPPTLIAQDNDEQYPPAPPEFVENLIRTIREDEGYQALQQLRVDRIEPDLATARQELPYAIEVQTRSFLAEMLDRRFVFLTDEAVISIAIRSESERHFAAASMEFVVVEWTWLDRRVQATYRVSPSALRELDFRFVESVTLVHPLGRRLAQFQANDETLPRVVEELCRQALQTESVINARLASQERVTLRLRDRTIAECLEMVANAVGWTVTYQVSRSERSRSRRDAATHEIYPRNATLAWRDVLGAYLQRDLLNLQRPEEEPIRTHGDALLHLLRHDSQPRIEAQRLVVTLLPNPDSQ